MNRTEFFENLNSSTKWDVGVAINRNNPLPLDASSIYESLTALETYAATSPTVYVGQICTVVSETEVAAYQITKIGEGATVKKLTATDASGDVVADIDELGVKVSALETKVTELETALGDTEAGLVKDVATLQSELETTKASVDANTESIDGITTDVANAKADITTVTELANTTKGKVDALETAAADYATKAEVATAKSEAVSEAVATIMGEAGIDEKYDTLKEVADWILTDSTNSAQLVAKVEAIEKDYLTSVDKTELNTAITELDTFIGELPEGAVSTTVIAYIKEAIDALKIGDYAKVSELTTLSETVNGINTRLGTAEASISAHDTQIAALEAKEYAVADITGLPEALEGKVDKEEGSRLINATEIEKLSRLVLNEDGSVETGSQVAAGDVVGLADWLADNGAANIKDLTESNLSAALVTKISGAIQEVAIDGTVLAETDGRVDLPLATTSQIGLVKLSSDFELNSEGAMQISRSEVFELNGGSAVGFES